MSQATGQLTFDVTPHPKLARAAEAGELAIAGELKIGGALRVYEDLNHGDELIITVTDRDGRVVARSYAEIAGPPPLVPIETAELGLLGYSRVHKAKLTEDLPL